MTAITVVDGEHYAYLLADGGAYGDDGTILQIRSKIEVCERHSIAVAHSGIVSTTFGLTEWMAEQPDQKAVLNGLPEKIREEIDGIAAAKVAYPEDFANFIKTTVMMHAYVALWSHEDQEPQAYIIASGGHKFGPSYKPYTVRRVSDVEQPGVDPKIRPPRKARNADWALPVIKQQRRTPDENGLCRVAAFAELVTVGPDRIDRKIIHRWRMDKVGRKARSMSRANKSGGAR